MKSFIVEVVKNGFLLIGLDETGAETDNKYVAKTTYELANAIDDMTKEVPNEG